MLLGITTHGFTFSDFFDSLKMEKVCTKKSNNIYLSCLDFHFAIELFVSFEGTHDFEKNSKHNSLHHESQMTLVDQSIGLTALIFESEVVESNGIDIGIIFITDFKLSHT
jgi:hypothetical protein